MKSAHFICKNGEHITAVGHPIYESGFWSISNEDAAALVGGVIHFHQKKSKASYFGGEVISYSLDKDGKIIFRIRSTDGARGQSWRGAKHNMAHYSGVLD